MRDLYHDSRSTYVVKPQTITGAGNGTGTDLLGYEGCLMIAHVGASGALLGSSNKTTIQFLESANNVVFSAIADGDLIGGNNTVLIDANEEANCTHQRSYVGSARYVTITYAATAGAVSLPVCAEVVKGVPLHGPIA
jgi:hypothetical protein